MDAKIIAIGNSKGIRLPKRLLSKYGFEEVVVIREMENGIFLEKEGGDKRSWSDTYREMAESDEDWSDWTNIDVAEMP